MEYLDHVGLGHVPRLTRVEWGVIRRCLHFHFFMQFLSSVKCLQKELTLGFLLVQFSWKTTEIF